MDLACQGHGTARRMENGRAKKRGKRPLGAQVRARGQRAKAGLAGGGGDHAAGHGALGGPGLRGAERRREVPGAGDFRQLPAVLDSWAGRPISAPLEHSQLIRNLAGGHRHELTENMRSDPGIFFVKWLRVGEEACPTLEQAKALKELYPSKPGWPDTTLVISHSKRMAVNAAASRALAPEATWGVTKREHLGVLQHKTARRA